MNSRAKGAEFERLVAREIEHLTGYKLKRNLEQYRSAAHGDLIGLPGYTIECKVRKAGSWPEESWWEQAENAAKLTGQEPVLIFRFFRQPIRVMARLSVHTNAESGTVSTQVRCILTLPDWIRAAGLSRISTAPNA